MIKPLVFFSLFIGMALTASAQSDSLTISVSGFVTSQDGLPLSNVMVVNKTSQHGIFAGADNKFTVYINRLDTLLIAATGYAIKKICFKDSAAMQYFNVTILLSKISYTIKPVTIISQRELQDIEKDIEKLGYDKNDYMLSGIDAFQSPITFLYQALSKRERTKREIAEKINDDKKRSLLKELFRKYVDGNIISLNEEEFDNFISFCNVSDEYLKNASQYDFIEYIKKRYEVYSMIRK